MADKRMARNYRRWHALLIVGYACYLAYFPIGSLGAIYLNQVASGWDAILLSRSLFLLSTILVIRFWASQRSDDFLTTASRARVNVSFALVILSFAVLFAASRVMPGIWAVSIFGLAFGAATATPKIGWYEAFTLVYEYEGRTRCVVDVAACFLVAAVPIILVPVMSKSIVASMSVLMGLTAISWVCYAAMSMDVITASVDGSSTSSHATAAADADPGVCLGPSSGTRKLAEPRLSEYHATSYTLAVLVSFGFVWGMSFTLTVTLGYGTENVHALWVMTAGLGSSAAVMLLFARLGVIERTRFGMLLRVVIVIAGSAWSLMDLAAMYAPALACLECSIIYIIQSTIMILFIAEICTDYHLTVCTVTNVHYGTFILSALLGALVYWSSFSLMEQRAAVMLIGGLCAVACLISIPFLPSRESKAGVFAMDTLPNDGVYEDALEAAIKSIQLRAGLTKRESEVFDYIVHGFTREQIAETLSLSVYTIKNHTASIYAKVGVHTRNELMALVYGVGSSEKGNSAE